MVVTLGTTAIIEDDLACKVYNIIGDKDWPSRVCNGGQSGIERASENATIDIISQNETQGIIGGHFFIQKEYQKTAKDVINEIKAGRRETPEH